MAKSLDEMVSKGRRKLEKKVPVMARNWENAKPDMKRSYSELPFGEGTKSAYAAGIDAAVYHTPDVAKWERGYRRGVAK